MIAEAYSARRAEFGDDALLVLDRGKDDKIVYMTIGSRPPELAIGGRRVFGVFAPPESQEPVASFSSQDEAINWATTKWGAASEIYKIGEIDSTDKPVVRVAVTALILHEGKVLLGKLKKTGHYVLPETGLEVGESIESAVFRAVKISTGLDTGKASVSKFAPYVSTFVEKAGQHFLTLVMATEYIGGVPVPLDPMWESVDWYDAGTPPKPLIATVQQIIALARYNAAPPAPPLALPAPKPAPKTKAMKARPVKRRRAS